MAIHKVLEVLSQSDRSWEEVKDGKIVQYRVCAKITFEVE